MSSSTSSFSDLPMDVRSRSAARELPEDDDDRYDDIKREDEDERTGGALAGLSAWGLSVVIHAVVLMLMMFIVFLSVLKEDQAPIQVRTLEPPPEQEQEVERELVEVEATVEAEVVVEEAVLTELELPVEELETEDEVVADVPVKGREEADAVAEMGGPGAFMAIGAGGGASGAFGNRSGGGRKRALGRYGGTKASESAVEAALRWFARHQSPNGQWDVDGYPQNCQDNPKCEPGGGWPGSASHAEADVGASGYAVLCFLGAGYDHRSANKFRDVVRRGLDWLVQGQKENGELGERNYAHPIATMALAEAYAMTNDPALREPTQKAVDLILERQCRRPGDDPEYSGLGWDYVAGTPTRNDSSVTGWCVMALKSAKVGGIDVGNGLEGSKRWLEEIWKSENPQGDALDPYTGKSTIPYTWNALGGRPTGFNANRDLTCVGLLCAAFLGYPQGDIKVETMANHIMEAQFPTGYPCNTYWMYYNTLGIFQAGGDRFKKWNDQVRDMLVNAQRKDACFDGSWDHKGTQFIGHQVGRLVSTAYCCLSLEVYYRYLPVAVKKAQR